MTDLAKARALAFLIPAALLAGAWGSQLIGHLYPCEMCHWQRWPHYAALVLALLAFVPRAPVRLLVALAVIAIAASGAIGIAHAGVEYHWWNGFTRCTGTFSGEGDLLSQMNHAPIIRCDVAQWQLFGISLAGFNAIISLTGAAVIAWLLAGRRRAA